MYTMKSKSRMLKYLIGILCLTLLPLAGASALDGSLNGSMKTFMMGVRVPLQQGDLYGLSDNSLRLQARVYPTDTLLIESAYSLSPQVLAPTLLSGEMSETLPSAGGGSDTYRAYDFDARLYPVKAVEVHNLAVYHNLDRLYVSMYLPFGDAYLGRQAISWGSAHVINPTDIIAPYSFSSLNTEEKRGVDALRLRLPIGAMSEVDLGYVAGRGFSIDESAAFARMRFYLSETDISVLSMAFKENLMLGFDASRSIGGAGSWIEAAYVLPDAFSENEPAGDQQYVNVSAGMDYNFGPKFYGYAEYHYNSAGKSNSDEYANIELRPEAHPAYTEGSVYLRGRHYGAIGGTYQLTPLIPVSGMLLMNVNDYSTNLSLDFEYNFTENVYISGGCYVGLGEASETEFGAYPDLYYLSIKLYF